MSSGDGYKYMTIHGHQRRNYIECTLIPFHFQNVWTALAGGIGRQKKIAVRVLKRDAVEKKTVENRLNISEFGRKFITVAPKDLQSLYSLCEDRIEQGNFAWMDLAADVSNVGLLNARVFGAHKNPYARNRSFPRESGNTIIYLVHDDDLAYLYLKEQQAVNKLLDYAIRNFFRNEHGSGFFAKLAPPLLSRIKTIRFSRLDDSILNKILKVVLTTGFTCYVEDYALQGSSLTLKFWKGLPPFVWMDRHSRVNEKNESFLLSFVPEKRQWKLEDMIHETFPKRRFRTLL